MHFRMFYFSKRKVEPVVGGLDFNRVCEIQMCIRIERFTFFVAHTNLLWRFWGLFVKVVTTFRYDLNWMWHYHSMPWIPYNTNCGDLAIGWLLKFDNIQHFTITIYKNEDTWRGKEFVEKCSASRFRWQTVLIMWVAKRESEIVRNRKTYLSIYRQTQRELKASSVCLFWRSCW